MIKISVATIGLTCLTVIAGWVPGWAQEGAGGNSATNLGPLVNSPDSDFGPIVTADGNALYFTSDRDGGAGEQDIWVSRRVHGRWTRAVNLGPPINTRYSEGPDTFSIDEKTMFFTRCDRLDQPGICDIYTAAWNQAQKNWGKVTPLGPAVNSIYNDANASLSYDGQTLYFVSDRPGRAKKRNWDIFVSKKRQGEWGQARRLGAPVNTDRDEIHVIIQRDDQTLYFSSDGHGGFGGTDIFYSRIKNGRFGAPVNMGDLINTSGQDIYFTIPASGDLAYLASTRPGGLGMEDIYSVPLGLATPQVGVIIIKGVVADRATCRKPKNGAAVDFKTCQPVIGAKVTIIEAGSKKTMAHKETDSAGFYQATLPGGKGYSITASAAGHKSFSAVLEIDRSKPFQVIEQNILLDPQE